MAAAASGIAVLVLVAARSKEAVAPPAPPRLDISPASMSDENHPSLRATAEGAEIALWLSKDCKGERLAPTASNRVSATLDVADDSSTWVSARTHRDGASSHCVTRQYIERTARRIIADGFHNAYGGQTWTTAQHDMLLAVWRRALTWNTTDHGEIWSATSQDDGRTWSSASVLVSMPGVDLRDPQLTLLSDGRLLLSYFIAANSGYPELHSLRISYSSDAGRSWSPPMTPDDQFTRYVASASPVLEVSPGHLVLPAYGQDVGVERDRIALLESKDNGASWVTMPARLLESDETSNSFSESALMLSRDGAWVLAAREDLHGRIWWLRSEDRGASWEVLSRDMEGSAAPRMLRADSGEVLVVLRRPGDLAAVLHSSRDEGRSFDPPVLLDPTARPMEYASLVQLPDGSIGMMLSRTTTTNAADVEFRRLVKDQTGWR
jgi:hypothetical protein